MIGQAISVAPIKKSGFAAKAVFYALHEGTGATLADAQANGPTITATGTLTNAWTNPNRFTFDSAGNLLRTANGNAFISSLFNASDLQDGSLITAFDLYYQTLPTTATETIFGALLAGGGTQGGIRVVVQTAGNIMALYTPAGSGEQTVFSSTTYGPTIGGVRNSYVLEWDFSIASDRVGVTLFKGGSIVWANDTPKAAPPIATNNAGLVLGAYATSSSMNFSFMGFGGSTGAGLARFLAVRNQKRDPRLAYAIADHWAGGSLELPRYMERGR